MADSIRFQSYQTATQHEAGYSLIELLTVLVIIAVLGSIATPNFKVFQKELPAAQRELVSQLKLIRAKAIATTLPHTVTSVTAEGFQVATSDTCGSASTATDTSLNFELPSGVEFLNIGWELCFTPQGFTNSDRQITIVDSDGVSTTIEQFIGGALRVQ